MTRRRLQEDSPMYKDIAKVEALMDELGLSISGFYLTIIQNNGYEYRIGEEQSEFPRALDEPFWRKNE